MLVCALHTLKVGIKTELQETALGMGLPATLAERSGLQIPGKIAHGYIV